MNKKIAIYFLIIALVISGTMNYKYIEAAKEREILCEHFLYYTYKSSLETYFNSVIMIENIVQMESDPVAMKEEILRVIDYTKVSDDVFQRAWILDSSFRPDISIFNYYLGYILRNSDDKAISEHYIESLTRITKVARELMPEDYKIYGELKESDYEKFVTKNGEFIDYGKTSNQLELSDTVLENFLSIRQICLELINKENLLKQN